MTDKTRLLRQIHPNFIQNGQVASIAFRPNLNDEGRLSVYDGDMISPERSYVHYTEIQQLESAGAMAVTVEECATLNLPVVSSPLPDFAFHAHIDFTEHLADRKQMRSKCKELLAFAERRGWQYKPPVLP